MNWPSRRHGGLPHVGKAVDMAQGDGEHEVGEDLTQLFLVTHSYWSFIWGYGWFT